MDKMADTVRVKGIRCKWNKKRWHCVGAANRIVCGRELNLDSLGPLLEYNNNNDHFDVGRCGLAVMR